MKYIYLTLAQFLLVASLQAGSAIKTAGDILAVAIPLGAYGTSVYLEDKKGQYQFYKSFGTTLLTTGALKLLVDEERPDGDGDDSFPSGHTSSAFAGASFIHLRYGIEYAVIPYMAAIYTGYTRVKTDRHYNQDVFAGAAIGLLSSWIFVDKYKNVSVTPLVDKDFKGLSFIISY
jgi:membrane-associated phospholipid phosphatase